MKNKNDAKALILETLKTKACLKQSIFKKTIEIFHLFKLEAEKLTFELKTEMNKIDKGIVVDFIDKDEHEFHIIFGGDILVFFMHTNVFEFDKSHAMFKTGYVKQNDYNSYSLSDFEINDD